MSEPVDRTARLRVRNEYGTGLNLVSVRHRVDNEDLNEDVRSWQDLSPGSTTDALEIHYQTNPGGKPPRDFWYAFFERKDGERFETVDDFMCDFREADENQSLTAVITPERFLIEGPRALSKWTGADITH